MRQLDKKERKLCESQLKRHKKELGFTKNNLDYNKGLINLQLDRRVHDDKWRDHLRSVKDEQDIKVLKEIEYEIENHEEHIKQLSEQLKGVKTPKFVE